MIYLNESRKSKNIKKQEKDFEEKNPHCIIDWVFSLEKYMKNRNINSIYATENEWDEMTERDKEQVDFNGWDFTYFPCGTPTFADCELTIIKKEYTYEEYLELLREEAVE